MTYILPGFPDENADGCPDDLMPDPAWVDGVGWPCIEIVIATPVPSTITVDTLADTGPLEVTGALLSGLLLLAAGVAMLARRSHDSSTTTTGEQR